RGHVAERARPWRRGGNHLRDSAAGEIVVWAAAIETAGGHEDCFFRNIRASARSGDSLRRIVLPPVGRDYAAGADGGTGGSRLLGRAGAAGAQVGLAGNRRGTAESRVRAVPGGGQRGNCVAARGDGPG